MNKGSIKTSAIKTGVGPRGGKFYYSQGGTKVYGEPPSPRDPAYWGGHGHKELAFAERHRGVGQDQFIKAAVKEGVEIMRAAKALDHLKSKGLTYRGELGGGQPVTKEQRKELQRALGNLGKNLHNAGLAAFDQKMKQAKLDREWANNLGQNLHDAALTKLVTEERKKIPLKGENTYKRRLDINDSLEKKHGVDWFVSHNHQEKMEEHEERRRTAIEGFAAGMGLVGAAANPPADAFSHAHTHHRTKDSMAEGLSLKDTVHIDEKTMSTRCKEQIAQALNAIEKVHGDGAMRIETVGATDNTMPHTTAGSNAAGAYNSWKNRITLNMDHEYDRGGTMLHEIGHALDFNGLRRFHGESHWTKEHSFASDGVVMMSNAQYLDQVQHARKKMVEEHGEAAAQVPDGHFFVWKHMEAPSHMREWKSTIVDSPPVKALEEMWHELPHQREHIDYLLTPTELLARSYHQYVAQRSEDRELSDAVHSRWTTANIGSPDRYQQWDVDEFDKIGQAMDRMFERVGWRKRKK